MCKIKTCFQYSCVLNRAFREQNSTMRVEPCFGCHEAATFVKSYMQSTLDNLVLQVGCLKHSLTKVTSYLLTPFLNKPKLKPALLKIVAIQGSSCSCCSCFCFCSCCCSNTAHLVFGIPPASILLPPVCSSLEV
jgi:hypothetical protein